MAERERVSPQMRTADILHFLRRTPGVFLTNNERDLSQSDFMCRIMPQTTLKVAPYRDASGYFAFEIFGGATVHMDLIKKQINPFEKLRLVRKAMPNTLIQGLCRGRNLFGYRPYPDNVVEMTVRLLSKYIDVWRMYDFLNYIPNLVVAANAVKEAGKLLMPCICFSTGAEHTDDFYARKVEEVLSLLGENIILCIKNHSALGSPARIAGLVRAIRKRFPNLLLSYHGHNTDGNDLARLVAAVQEGVKIVEVSDHGYGGTYSQAPALTAIQNLRDYGFKTPGLNIAPILDASDILQRERRLYDGFTGPIHGFDPTVKRHMLPGGALSLAMEQAEKAGLLDRTRELLSELIEIRKELGNIWVVTPGSQILWSTALSNVLNGRYEKPSDDLKRLLLGRYGPFPFYDPPEWIFKKVLESGRTDGKKWDKILADEGGLQDIADEDLKARRLQLESRLKRPSTNEELCMYVQFPRDALDFIHFEERFGQTWLLPPEVWFHRGGFADGTRISFADESGKTHHIDLISTRKTADGVHTSFLVDYHFQTCKTLKSSE
ncbi:MAG: pyruvate carboxylase [Deltaproteobacteria bacterium]|nr:pyruvate carboxylase [Deltaproteobacteria bacterium]